MNKQTDMDRSIPIEEQRKKRRKRLVIGGGSILFFFLLIVWGTLLLKPSVDRAELQISTVERGVLEISINASGTVTPAYEEIVNSPIESRVLEVYKKAGDSVEANQPILKLDLQSARTDLDKLIDEEQMRLHKQQQLKLNNQTKLKDLSMQIRVSSMKLNRMEVEWKNERFLDSLGAGTPDKVRQAELNYKVAKLEHEQLCQQYENEQTVMHAEEQVQELDLSIFRKGVTEMKRILQEAQVYAPRKGVITYLNDQIGVRVAKGEQLVTVADLSRYQVKSSIADSYSDRVTQGAKAIVKAGETTSWEGVVNHVIPTSKDGTIDFTVQLREVQNAALRSGLKTDVHVIYGLKNDVLRITNNSYYLGAGTYELFVVSGNRLERREVVLGDCNWDYVEVVSGLQEGDQVVVSDMNAYKNRSEINLK